MAVHPPACRPRFRPPGPIGRIHLRSFRHPQTASPSSEPVGRAPGHGVAALKSVLNNEFIAYELDKSTVIHINGDDGEVTELGQGLDVFFETVADAWPSA